MSFNGGGKRFGGARSGGGSRFGGRDSGRGGFGARKSFGGDRGGERRSFEMHDAVCSECNKNCQVPFAPTGEKPVYCSDCFRNTSGRDGDRSPRRDFGGARGGRGSFDSAPNKSNEDTDKQLRAINAKLDKVIAAVETLVARWEK